MYVSGSGIASFLRSTFEGNTIFPDSSGAGVIEAESDIGNINTLVRPSAASA